MSQSSNPERSTSVLQFIKAPRHEVYQAFVQPEAVETWLAPDTMRAHVEVYEPHEGGRFRMTLTYLDDKDRPQGKTSDDTDVSEGTFVHVIPDEKIVQAIQFESDQPDMAGEMTITWTLADADHGTTVTVRMDNIPQGVRLEDNELGSQQSLRKLAAYVEHKNA